MPKYRLIRDSAQYNFIFSRAKVTIFGGGFGNGKTAALVIRTLNVARDYPGANILLARSTYPKLNDTLRKEFFKWCPKSWYDKGSWSKNDNTLVMNNGTTINFRYVSQQGKSQENTTSNLLSATYDFIGVDQVEDPEIAEKDFLDLLGRLRGNAEYIGTDKTRPRSGPREIALTCNPTRNWVWRRLVRPLKLYEQGVKAEGLMLGKDGKPIIELHEASTYTNSHNLGADFIETLEAAYTGQMRDRFLLGQWAAYEGLVYPEFDMTVHMVEHSEVLRYLSKLRRDGYTIPIIQAYDHGMSQPSCYGLWFTDPYSNMILLDGFYQKEASPEWSANRMKGLLALYHLDNMFAEYDAPVVYADPDIFRRKGSTSKTVGISTASMFEELGINMVAGNNDIDNGIVKIRSLLAIKNKHRNPFTNNLGAPHMFVSSKCDWWVNEITDYMWKRSTDGELEDKPRDKNDHAMDMTKYACTHLPSPARAVVPREVIPPGFLRWNEMPDNNPTVRNREHRYM